MLQQTQIKKKLLLQKKEAKHLLCERYGFSDFDAPVGIILLQDKKIGNFITTGLTQIGCNLFVLSPLSQKQDEQKCIRINKIKEPDVTGCDFFVSDYSWADADIKKYMCAWVVPILPSVGTFHTILKEFNPIHYEGNAFLYKQNNPYVIFREIIICLENFKFPQDKKTLLQHVSETFVG